MLRVAFIGQASYVGCAIALAGHRLVAVARQPARPRSLGALVESARGHFGVGRPLRKLATETGAKLLPTGLGSEPAFVRAVRDVAPDVIICAGWPRRLSGQLLGLPRLGCFNVHPSLLPRHRGPHPCAWTLLHGEATAGVTIHRMNERFDAGPIVAQRTLDVLSADTRDTLEDRCMYQAMELLPGILDGLERGTLVETPQDESSATAEKRTARENFRLDFSLPASELHNRIRAATSNPGAWTVVGSERKRARIEWSIVISGRSGARPGTVLAAVPPWVRVAAGEDELLLVLAGRWAASAVVGASLGAG